MNNESGSVKGLPVQAYPEEVLLEYKYLQSLCLMTRGVTHDYNNIFTGLSGQLKLIAQEAGCGGISGHRFGMVNELLTRGSKRTAILYEFSRYICNEKAEHSLDRILELALESLNTLSRTHQFVVEKRGVLPRLHCRMKDLVMMLFYLGENAMEAMPEGGTVSVVAEMDRKEEAVILSVRNKGEGVSSKVRGSLFQPFVTTKSPHQGLRGLGLYSAQIIARQNGGTISFSDDSNQETVFSAKILRTCVTAEIGSLSSKEQIAIPSTFKKKEFDRIRETFFVVEDDEAMRDLIVNGLQRRGHVVFSAETCAEALEDFEILHEAVTVLLIDIGLTDSDGFECLKAMLKISRHIKVIFMSGEDADKHELRKYNAAFLKKPFTVKEIEQLVSHAK